MSLLLSVFLLLIVHIALPRHVVSAQWFAKESEQTKSRTCIATTNEESKVSGECIQSLNEPNEASLIKGQFPHRFWTAAVAAARGVGALFWQASASDSETTAEPKSQSTSDIIVPSFISQFRTVDDVPQEYFKEHKSIYAFVERIIDGDTIRVSHVPGYGIFKSAPEPLQQRGIAKDTLSIRIYAVDTPEIAKNKSQTTQPFGEEATQFTSDLVFHSMVKITFLRKDQYKRAVAVVETAGNFLPGFRPKDLSKELAREGLAELYTGGGAEYNGQRGEFETIIDQAKRRKKGIWSLGEGYVSAAEQKRLNKEAAAGNDDAQAQKKRQQSKRIMEKAVSGLEVATTGLGIND